MEIMHVVVSIIKTNCHYIQHTYYCTVVVHMETSQLDLSTAAQHSTE